MSGRRAFTLLELVLAIAIVSLLIVLLSPALGRVRALGLRTKTLAYLRSNATILHTYTMDWKDCWPDFADPKATTSFVRVHSGYVQEVPFYFMSGWYWHVALADGYYGGDVFNPSVYPAEQTAQYGSASGNPFDMPCAFFADPKFWNGETRTGRGQYRGTFAREVLYPDRKSLLVSLDQFHYGATGQASKPGVKIPLVCVDGHVQVLARDQILPGHPTAENDPQKGLHTDDFYPALHTIDGLRGRDVP